MQPVRTSYGFRLVVHNFANAKRVSSSRRSGFVTTSTTASSSENLNPVSTESISSSSSSSSSSSIQSSSKEQHRFLKGQGEHSSFLYQRTSETGLTADDARRISTALKKRAGELPGHSIHALMTGNGSPYQNIQGRIM